MPLERLQADRAAAGELARPRLADGGLDAEQVQVAAGPGGSAQERLAHPRTGPGLDDDDGGRTPEHPPRPRQVERVEGRAPQGIRERQDPGPARTQGVGVEHPHAVLTARGAGDERALPCSGNPGDEDRGAWGVAEEHGPTVTHAAHGQLIGA